MDFFRSVCLLLSICWLDSLSAQTPTQTLRGNVRDAIDSRPIRNAHVQLVDQVRGANTDSLGRFVLEKIPVGRYTVSVSHLGYGNVLLPAVLVESGKENVLEIFLQPQSAELSEVVVRAATSPLTPIGHHTLSLEETLRFPATFDDPVRLATSFPGVTVQNDQANNLIIRGNDPAGLLWRLEGLDIVNPNHLSNAGTFSDRATRNGGGVNIMSAHLLGTSALLTTDFPTGYGNLQSGALDMQLRSGNNREREYTLQASLLGFDFSTEAPFSDNKKGSYLINYRYSFTGLLTALGADFGGEAIGYQDLAFHTTFPTSRAGTFSFFGMGGLSKNEFTGERDSTLWEEDKDRQDITFENKVGVIGLSHLIPLPGNASLESAIGISALENNRQSSYLYQRLARLQEQSDENSEHIFSFFSRYKKRIRQNDELSLGVRINQQRDVQEFMAFNLREAFRQGGSADHWVLQPHVSWTGWLGRLRWEIGGHGIYYSLLEKGRLEPRAHIQYFWNNQPTSQSSVSLSFGSYSRLPVTPLFFVPLENSSAKLNPIRSRQLNLAYRYSWQKLQELSLSLYYQQLEDVPAASNTGDRFAALNGTYLFDLPTRLTNSGKGENYGLELSWRRHFNRGFYYFVNGTVFRSIYQAVDGYTRRTPYDGRFGLNAMGGKEFSRHKKGSERIFGLNLKLVYRGGLWVRPVDAIASQQAGFTVLTDGSPTAFDEVFSQQLKDYIRLDARLYWKRNKPGRHQTISIDIQNVLSRENEAYLYYDLFTQQTETRRQLGLIPNISYRISF